MGIFQSKESKEVESALNNLNEKFLQHYDDWDWVLKINIGAEAASQQPLDGVVQAVRTMWVECLARSIYLGIDCRQNFELVKMQTPAISKIISDSRFNEIEFQQSTRIVQRVLDLVEKISEINPAYRERLAQLKKDPEFQLIQEESQLRIQVALEKGKFNTRTEMFVIKGH